MPLVPLGCRGLLVKVPLVLLVVKEQLVLQEQLAQLDFKVLLEMLDHRAI